MVMANEMAVKMNLMSEKEALRVKALLEKYNLPTSYIINDVKKFYETFFLDKKSSDSSITFILPLGIGDVVITDKADVGTVMCVLNQFGKA
jgi:3-dehydroquinate synthase